MNEQTCVSFREIVEGEAQEPVSTRTPEPQRKIGRRKKEKVVGTCIVCGSPTKHKKRKHCSMKCSIKTRNPLSPLERLLSFIEIDEVTGCWNWTAAVRPDGYGAFAIYDGANTLQNRIEQSAHRSSWHLHIGPIPKPLCVLHKCDNTLCINPDHLFLGTPADNNRDMREKGRGRVPKGSECTCAKLTEDDVRKIRQLHSEKMCQRRIAELFAVGYKAINKIVKGYRWKHVH